MTTSRDEPATSGTLHAETIGVPWQMWPIGTGLTLAMGTVFLPIHPYAALVAMVVTAGVVLAFVRSSRMDVRVGGGELVAGPARVPVRLLGEVRALDREAMREERGPRLDARAYLAMKGWVPTGVRVALLDPQDPTPYWIVSSRRPQALAEALRAARAEAGGGASA